jgi:phosphoglycerate kinase
MPKKALKDVDLAGQTVFCRVDFNVPLDGKTITDDTRIRAALPTIQALANTRLILTSHLGRPDGAPDPKYSLEPCAARLAELVGKPVTFVPDCVGPAVAEAAAKMQVGDVLLLENVRFHAGETSKDKDEFDAFSRALAAPATAFVDDAFGSVAKKQASVTGVTKYLSPCVQGFLMEKEVSMLGRVYSAPTAGFVVVLGGAKVTDKIDVIKSLLPRCEKMLIGGAMSWAFLKAQGREIGMSYCPEGSPEAAAEILATMGDDLAKLMLPVDVRMQNVQGDHSLAFGASDAIRPGWDAMDIGLETRELYAGIVRAAQTVFWNGPMGKFEDKPFDEGTLVIAQAMGDCPGFNVVGGGDSVAAVTQMGLADKMDHVSTGGGASLEYLAKGSLVGVDVLDEG